MERDGGMDNSVEAVTARLSNRKVAVPLSDAVKDLRERGFGEINKRCLHFAPTEALYLAEKGRIKVLDGKGTPLSLHDLAKRLADDKYESWIKYLIYRDLRDRGYIVRGTSRFDFEVQGKGALRRLVTIIHEGRDASLARMGELLRYSQKEKKELVLAVIDRRTDIVYYTLDSLSI